MDDSIRSDMHYYEEIAHQLAANSAVLFLGSGSTRNCRTRDGQGAFPVRDWRMSA